jgi:hypothetical protein
VSYQGLGELPGWLKAAVSSVISATRITVNTPLGPITIDPTNPADVERARSILSSVRVAPPVISVQPRPAASPVDRALDFADKFPGGPAGLVLGAGLLLAAVLKRR